MDKTITTQTQTRTELFKKSISEIRSIKKIPKEIINDIQQLNDEEKMEYIKELISSHNYLTSFYQTHQNNNEY